MKRVIFWRDGLSASHFFFAALPRGSVPTVYGLRQIDRLLPSAEGTAEGSKWKCLRLRQLAVPSVAAEPTAI